MQIITSTTFVLKYIVKGDPWIISSSLMDFLVILAPLIYFFEPSEISKLIYFMPLVSFHIPWEHQKSSGF